MVDRFDRFAQSFSLVVGLHIFLRLITFQRRRCVFYENFRVNVGMNPVLLRYEQKTYVHSQNETDTLNQLLSKHHCNQRAWLSRIKGFVDASGLRNRSSRDSRRFILM
jgi:hypothetical protein